MLKMIQDIYARQGLWVGGTPFISLTRTTKNKSTTFSRTQTFHRAFIKNILT